MTSTVFASCVRSLDELSVGDKRHARLADKMFMGLEMQSQRRKFPSKIVLFAALSSLMTPGLIAQDQSPSAAKNLSEASQTAPQSAPTHVPEIPSASNSSSSLRLGTGDLVEISVYNVPELSTKARVSSTGDIYLPLIDYVRVGGLSADQAQSLIQQRLTDGGFVKNPHVSVFVQEYASQGASVLGEVARPGVYPVLGQQRLFDVISAAGGFTEKAGQSIMVTHRSQPDKSVTVPLARNATDSPEGNIAVFPGDTIVVRKADVIYVVGEVGRPSGFMMDGGHLTVLQAIALAGGTTRVAKLSGTRILHKGPAGMTETTVALKKILEAKSPDITMQADDILFVPTSAAKAAAGRTMDAVIQTASALSIVAVH
jgi:polysaccharide biosynthesis/export protein